MELVGEEDMDKVWQEWGKEKRETSGGESAYKLQSDKVAPAHVALSMASSWRDACRAREAEDARVRFPRMIHSVSLSYTTIRGFFAARRFDYKTNQCI
jgi:hypothetical protein